MNIIKKIRVNLLLARCRRLDKMLDMSDEEVAKKLKESYRLLLILNIVVLACALGESISSGMLKNIFIAGKLTAAVASVFLVYML